MIGVYALGADKLIAEPTMTAAIINFGMNDNHPITVVT